MVTSNKETWKAKGKETMVPKSISKDFTLMDEKQIDRTTTWNALINCMIGSLYVPKQKKVLKFV